MRSGASPRITWQAEQTCRLSSGVPQRNSIPESRKTARVFRGRAHRFYGQSARRSCGGLAMTNKTAPGPEIENNIEGFRRFIRKVTVRGMVGNVDDSTL